MSDSSSPMREILGARVDDGSLPRNTGMRIGASDEPPGWR